MGRAGLRAFTIAMLVAMTGMSTLTQGYAQTRKGSFEVGVEAGPFMFFAVGGHEFLGVFLLSVDPHVGYFLSEELAVGVTGFLYRSVDGALSEPALSFGGVFGHVKYHFNSGNSLSPYFCGRIGIFTSDSEVRLALGAQIGLLFFVSRQVSISGTVDVGAIPDTGGVVFLTGVNLGVSFHIP